MNEWFLLYIFSLYLVWQGNEWKKQVEREAETKKLFFGKNSGARWMSFANPLSYESEWVVCSTVCECVLVCSLACLYMCVCVSYVRRKEKKERGVKERMRTKDERNAKYEKERKRRRRRFTFLHNQQTAMHFLSPTFVSKKAKITRLYISCARWHLHGCCTLVATCNRRNKHRIRLIHSSFSSLQRTAALNYRRSLR